MKTKILLLLIAICVLASAAWYARGPRQPTSAAESNPPAAADEVPAKDRGTVAKGLAFLAKHQRKDGHWEGDDGKHPVAMTGFVGIALLMEKDAGHDRLLGRRKDQKLQHSATVNKAVDWLLQQSKPERDGLIFSEHPSETTRYMEGHGLATMFLAGVCKDETDKARRAKLADVLMRAVKYIARAQSSQGGWYHTSRAEGHDFDTVAVTTIQIQALQAADRARIPLPADVLARAQEYMRRAVEKHENNKTSTKHRRLADTASASACRFHTNMLGNKERQLRHDWLAFCSQELPATRKIQFDSDDLIHYYYAQAWFDGGKEWMDYYDAIHNQLKAAQNEDGGWPSNVGGGGRVYTTALWCTVLQLEGENYPARRNIEAAFD